MQKYEVAGHVPSYLPESSQWKLVWNDEFDGKELDRSKWDFRLNFWGAPFAAYTDKGVVLDGESHVELHRVYQDGYYASAQLQTGSNSFDIPKDVQKNPWGQNDIWPLGDLAPAKFVHRFGFYECRCKFQKHPDEMWSAFWTQSPTIGASFDPAWCGVESDIMECFKTNHCTTGNIMGGYGKQFRQEGRVQYDLEPTADDWHTFAMHWTPTAYTFYCDGKIVTTANQDVSQVPQFILLTTEVQGYRSNRQKQYDHFEDDAFICDYVRVFDEI